MRTLILAIAIANICFDSSNGQNIITGGTTIHSGNGEDQVSKSYEMKGPYILEWVLTDLPPSKKDDPYWKPRNNNDRLAPWISVKVYDAVTRKIIEHESVSGRVNHMTVPEGGKHYVVVSSFSDLQWTIRGKEGKLSDGGKESKIIPNTAADLGGGSAKDTAETVIEDLNKTFKGSDLETRLAAVRLVQSRSNSAKDFAERWAEYRRVQGW